MSDYRYNSPVEAIEASLKTWQWLADNPGFNKCEAYLNLNLEYDTNHCPLCQYVYERGDEDYLNCNICPLAGKWIYVCNEGYTPCERSMEYGQAWLDANDAKPMVILLKNALKSAQINPSYMKVKRPLTHRAFRSHQIFMKEPTT